MFTGLIEARVAIRALESVGEGARLFLPPPNLAPDQPAWEPVFGESIAISGCCLTVIAVEPDGAVAFDLSRETLERTRFGSARAGDVVNLERSVRLADRLGGHLVSGHVDGVGTLVDVRDPGDGGRVYTFEVPEDFRPYLVQKGSVSVEGISLTVVDPDGCRFDVALIPETLARTNLGVLEPGAPVHLEADQIGKWVERLLEARGAFG